MKSIILSLYLIWWLSLIDPKYGDNKDRSPGACSQPDPQCFNKAGTVLAALLQAGFSSWAQVDRGRSRLEAKGSAQRCGPTLLGRGATAGRAGGLWEEGTGTVPHQAPGRRPSPGNVLCISFTDCLSGRRQSLHPAPESASAKAKLVSLKAQKLRKWNLAPPVLG